LGLSPKNDHAFRPIQPYNLFGRNGVMLLATLSPGVPADDSTCTTYLNIIAGHIAALLAAQAPP